MNTLRLLIRADAGVNIGMGHVMRCMALAEEAAKQGHDVFFAGSGIPAIATERMEKHRIAHIMMPRAGGSDADALATLNVATRINPDWIIVDNYGLGASWEAAVGSGKWKVMAIDDLPSRKHACDILLDQNLDAPNRAESIVPGKCVQLLGLNYTLIRKEFMRPSRQDASSSRDAVRVLITLGGGASQGLLQRIIATVLMGPLDDQHQDSISNSKHTLHLCRGTADMPAHLGKADVIVSAGGSTCWEASIMGKPLILLCLAENQRNIVRSLVSKKCALEVESPFDDSMEMRLTSLLTLLATDVSLRSTMSQHISRLVDGKGAMRVLEILSREANHENCLPC